MDSSLPSDTAATTKPSEKDVELQRKRARDRKSQQAMRDRTRWTIQTLTDQVAMLSAALEEKARHAAILETQVAHLTGQNMQLHKERVSMELSMLDGTSGVGGSTLAAGAEYPMSSYQDDEAASQNHSSGSSPMSNPAAAVTSIQTRPPLPPTGPWEISPANSPPSCLADEMLQRFVDAWRGNPHSGGAAQGTPPARLPSGYALRTFEQKPDFESVFPQIPRHNDGVSHLVSDIVKTCYKINGWPQHVALFYIMSTFVNVSPPVCVRYWVSLACLLAYSYLVV